MRYVGAILILGALAGLGIGVGAAAQPGTAPPANAERLQESGCEVVLPDDQIRERNTAETWSLAFSDLEPRQLACAGKSQQDALPRPNDILWVQLVLEDISWPDPAYVILIKQDGALVQQITRDDVTGNTFLSTYLVKRDPNQAMGNVIVLLDSEADSPQDQEPSFVIRRIVRALTLEERGIAPGMPQADVPDTFPVSRYRDRREDLRILSDATVKINGSGRYATAGESFACSGFAVGRDLVLTNNHCVSKEGDVQVPKSIACRDAFIWFDFYSDETASGLQAIECAELVTEDANLDFSLLRLKKELPPTANGGIRRPLCLSKDPPNTAGMQVITAHHPEGRAMRFQDQCQLATRGQTNDLTGKMQNRGVPLPNREHVWAHACGTRPGSSGAPLFHHNHVVALHFGTAYASDWPDYKQNEFIEELIDANIRTINTAFSAAAIREKIAGHITREKAPNCEGN